MNHCCFLAVALLAGVAEADTVRVAVASNFVPAAVVLGERFHDASGHTVEWVPGSTGKLYAQIVNGAPFDVFLAADVERPRRLEAEGHVVAGSRRTYAEGRLVAWSRKQAADGSACLAALGVGVPGKVAIANPELAPYGVAARAYLVREGLWETVQPRLVFGENVAQALQFAANGGAVVALVGASQLFAGELPEAACTEALPPGSYPPIEQQLVWLERAAHNAAAAAWIAFLTGEDARAIIESYGYRVPRP